MKIVKRIIVFLCGMMILLPLSVVLFNFIVDPYLYYRYKTFYPIYYSIERYQNAGLLRNADYDSVVMGTSTSENFLLNEVSGLPGFTSPIKLTVSGGTSYEISTTLRSAIDKHKDLKNVLWGIDFLSCKGNPLAIRGDKGSFPFYLYDDSIMNDYKYLLSYQTLIDSVKVLVFPFKKSETDPLFHRNTMYQWQHLNENNFNRKFFMDAWETRPKFDKKGASEFAYEQMKNNFDSNFLPIIRDNRNINFVIYLPPYSSYLYKFFNEWSLQDDITEFRNYLITTLPMYPNVQLYDFQAETKVTDNIANYKDMNHFSQNISTWILKQMQQKKNLVSRDNASEFMHTFETTYPAEK